MNKLLIFIDRIKILKQNQLSGTKLNTLKIIHRQTKILYTRVSIKLLEEI